MFYVKYDQWGHGKQGVHYGCYKIAKHLQCTLFHVLPVLHNPYCPQILVLLDVKITLPSEFMARITLYSKLDIPPRKNKNNAAYISITANI